MGGGETHSDCESESNSQTAYPFTGHHLLLAWPADAGVQKIIATIRQRYPALKVSHHDPASGEVDDETWRTVSILSTFATLPGSPALVPKMEFLHLLSAGSNHIAQHPIYTDSDIVLTTSSGIHGPAISEWVILTLLSHAHRFPLLLEWRGEHKWPGRDEREDLTRSVADYAGKTLAVLGYGSIGRQVARVAASMGMRVLAYTASRKESAESRRDDGFVVPGTGDVDGSIPTEWYSGLEKKELHAFLAQDFDVLVICVPLTEKTKGLLGNEEFEILGRKGGRHPFVVNIARGQIVVQSALIQALKRFQGSVNGRDGEDQDEDKDKVQGIRGAALDVTDPEPLDSGNELWQAPNLFISPHVSGNSVAYLDRAALVLEGNLEKFRKGEKLWNVVDRDRGY